MSDNSELIQRVAVLEEKTKNNDNRIDLVEIKTNDTTRLSTMMEMSQAQFARQQEQMTKQYEQMVELNTSLKELSGTYKNLDKRVGKLEENQASNKIDLGSLFKQILFVTVPMLIGAWLLIQFGLK